MDKNMIEEQDIKKIALAVVDLLVEKKYVGKATKPRTQHNASADKDMKLFNERSVKSWIEQGLFKDPKYDFPEYGPYDWRYLINHGEKLSAARAMVAFYWKEKSAFTKLGVVYSFPSKGTATTVMMQEMRAAEQLVSSIRFADLKRLIDLVDDKYSEMFKDRRFEWKMKNLCENVYLLSQ